MAITYADTVIAACPEYVRRTVGAPACHAREVRRNPHLPSGSNFDPRAHVISFAVSDARTLDGFHAKDASWINGDQQWIRGEVADAVEGLLVECLRACGPVDPTIFSFEHELSMTDPWVDAVREGALELAAAMLRPGFMAHVGMDVFDRSLAGTPPNSAGYVGEAAWVREFLSGAVATMQRVPLLAGRTFHGEMFAFVGDHSGRLAMRNTIARMMHASHGGVDPGFAVDLAHDAAGPLASLHHDYEAIVERRAPGGRPTPGRHGSPIAPVVEHFRTEGRRLGRDAIAHVIGRLGLPPPQYDSTGPGLVTE